MKRRWRCLQGRTRRGGRNKESIWKWAHSCTHLVPSVSIFRLDNRLVDRRRLQAVQVEGHYVLAGFTVLPQRRCQDHVVPSSRLLVRLVHLQTKRSATNWINQKSSIRFRVNWWPAEWATVSVPKVSGRAGELLAAADNFRPSRTCCRRPLPCSTAERWTRQGLADPRLPCTFWLGPACCRPHSWGIKLKRCRGVNWRTRKTFYWLQLHHRRAA